MERQEGREDEREVPGVGASEGAAPFVRNGVRAVEFPHETVKGERELSLALQLALALLAPIALCLVAYGYVNVRIRHAEMLSEAAREVKDHGTVLEVALDAVLRDHEIEDLNELTEDLSRADRVLGVLVFDAAAAPVQSSRSVTSLRPRFAALARRVLRERRPREELARIGGRTLYAYAFPIGDSPAVRPRGTAVLLRDLAYIDEHVRGSTRRIALVGLALAAAIGLALWRALRATVLRPVASLVDAAERVGAGSLDEVVAVEGRDEVGRLGRAFNRMVASLRNARADLDAQHEATRALERRLRHAQRLALVGQLAANVAHQVGSPLNVVIGRARYALQQGGQSERDARHLQEILVGGEQISRVIEQLLSQARKARGAPQEVDLAGLARDTLRFLEIECERLGVVAQLRAAGAPRVRGSRDELEQVLLNLCVNALQAQPRGGALTVTIGEREDARGDAVASITVDDAGPGIPRELHEQVFEPFFTTKGPAEGTGLGLAICDELVRRQGGTIKIETSPLGGARLCVALPLAPRTPPEGDR